MADRICSVCGASNPPDAAFCRVCDTYFDWDGPGDAPKATHETAASQGGTTGTTTTTATASTGPTAEQPTGDEATPRPQTEPRAAVPVALLEQTEVVVTPQSPGTVGIVLKNASDIVDGIVVHPAAPPPWLVMTQEDANLYPGETRTVQVTFATRPGVLVVAQQVDVPLVVRSSIDPAKLVEVSVQLTVPRLGPPPTLSPRPTLVHVNDTGEGQFTLSFDNRAANYPHHYTLSAHDPEDVVRVGFLPPAVDVPAGGTVETTVRFTAPEPEPGQEVSRQVTITATSEDGQVTSVVTITQRTAAPPERHPVAVRLEPSHLQATGDGTVAFDVVIDNRASDVGVALSLGGRDPQRLVAFSFGENRLVVGPHRVTTVHALLRTAAPPPGTTQTRQFTVVANDGETEVEAPGVLEVTSRAAPITTARLQVEPSTLATQDRHGVFGVHVDNRKGADVLRVRLAGTDEFGRARLTFTPPEVAVPAGQVATVRLSVDSEPPPGGQTSSRRLRITASDGSSAVEAEATLTQTSTDHRPAAKRWLVVLGSLLAMFGAVLPWLGTMIDPNSVIAVATDAAEGNQAAIAPTATAASTVLVVLLGIMMLFGLNSTSGRGIRFAAVLMILIAVGAAVAGAPGTGLVLVVVGAVLGFIGGVLARSARRT
ncbi:zinc ribbon domain-containing protein [Cellulomonas sp.]|uniref:zinc ribbon domain-containing protein n=1 Tax=Cellulomonas sp. TaxID=40001 RepID=UPI001B2F6A28|nr:zinc ribbon domain-containing protein [Cellulomonas sp.]MBO9556760.1 hypothetical protein [Cellulomonas sp.]